MASSSLQLIQMKINIPIILASGSPRRSQLLGDAGFDFKVFTREVDESLETHQNPRLTALLIAEKKAGAYKDLSDESLIITADTVVGVDEEILGKPSSREDAIDMLLKLSARTHHVFTGVSFVYKGQIKSFTEQTLVHVKQLTMEEIEFYIDTQKPYDKAGAYGIQDWFGLIAVTGINGDFYNVVGLPVARLIRELKVFIGGLEEK